MSFQYEGRCSCGETTLLVELYSPISSYIPRACDCDFCIARGIAYLSEPEGKAEIHSQLQLNKLKQGSNQAQFLGCANCDSIVAVGYLFNSGFKGAVNATLLNDKNKLQQAVAASPKRLKPDEKIERWQKLWMAIKLYEGEQSNC